MPTMHQMASLGLVCMDMAFIKQQSLRTSVTYNYFIKTYKYCHYISIIYFCIIIFFLPKKNAVVCRCNVYEVLIHDLISCKVLTQDSLLLLHIVLAT